MFMPSFPQVSTRGDTVYTFSSIEKDEYSRLYDFFKAKKIAVKSVSHKMRPVGQVLAASSFNPPMFTSPLPLKFS